MAQCLISAMSPGARPGAFWAVLLVKVYDSFKLKSKKYFLKYRIIDFEIGSPPSPYLVQEFCLIQFPSF